jgi:hypothetical protein
MHCSGRYFHQEFRNKIPSKSDEKQALLVQITDTSICAPYTYGLLFRNGWNNTPNHQLPYSVPRIIVFKIQKDIIFIPRIFKLNG